MSAGTHIYQVGMSDAAAQRVHELISLEGDAQLKLRLSIMGGGCSGFQYSFAFDKKTEDDDLVFEKNDVCYVIDSISMMYLNGAEIDYVENLQGAHFTVKNPNANTTCSCGSSFSIESE